jgi:hypothetical protein
MENVHKLLKRSPFLAACQPYLFLAKILSGVNAFRISNHRLNAH